MSGNNMPQPAAFDDSHLLVAVLPAGLQAKFGKFLSDVGYINNDGSAADPPGSGGGGQTSANCTVIYESGVEASVVSMINAIRGESGLPPLGSTSALTVAARGHSEDMATHDFVSHTGSDGSLWYGRIANQGYAYSYALENIYVGNPAFGGTAAGAVDWWMNSQIHRENILSQAVTAIGVGYAYCDTSTYGGYYTAVFAKP